MYQFQEYWVPQKRKESEVTQSCLTLCDPTDCSLPGSSIHGIFQARVLEWVAIPFSRGSSQPRDQTQVSHMAGGFWATREALGPKMMTQKLRGIDYAWVLGICALSSYGSGIEGREKNQYQSLKPLFTPQQNLDVSFWKT